MKEQYKDINNECFRVGKPINKNDLPKVMQNRSLYDCYKNPSDIKRVLFNYWRNFFYNNTQRFTMWISSYNIYHFTITCITVIDNTEYLITVSKSKKIIQPIIPN